MMLVLLERFLGPAHRRDGAQTAFSPLVTVFFSALNEEERVADRILNILQANWPAERLEVIVVSDGSSDGTAEITRQIIAAHPARSIRLYEMHENRGRAFAQNLVAGEAKGDILIATDAETVFDRDTIRHLVSPFADPTVGVVGGDVRYEVPKGTAEPEFARAYDLYRRMESSLRRAESNLALLVKTDGPCTAFRRDLWTPIEAFEDVDQVICLLARKHGLRAEHAPAAICVDRANGSRAQEVGQRARMTRKALLSTFNRWRSHDWLAHPTFTFVLMSHKVFRFASPALWLIFAVALLLSVAQVGGPPGGVLLIALAVALWTTTSRAPMAGLLRALVAAQLAFALGVCGWVGRKRDGRYQPTRSLQ